MTAHPTTDSRLGLDRRVTLLGPLTLDSGAQLTPIDFAYETYGALNDDKSNAVLICHATTGDQYVASTHPLTNKPGWWTSLVGTGLPIDPARHFVICINALGSCMGSSGPNSVNIATGAPYALSFPVVTIRDMVRAQALLLDYLGIETLFAIVGGSMGGMQALSWAATFPDRAKALVVIAATARHSAQNLAFHWVGRQAIMADPNWRGGNYYASGEAPNAGLSVARMIAHNTYLSAAGMEAKFGRNLQHNASNSYSFDANFTVESYLSHQGVSFTDRFDANAYLYMTRAMNYFDLAEEHGGTLSNAFRATKARFCLISFDTDWLCPTAGSKAIVHALNAVGAPVSFVELSTPHGHDAFLMDMPEQNRVIDGFMRAGNL